jgi:GGDEF domain-containing protein
VLKVFARRIKDSIREDVDWLARFGGEEFLIILPETLKRNIHADEMIALADKCLYQAKKEGTMLKENP